MDFTPPPSSTRFSFTADEAEELGLDADDDDNTADSAAPAVDVEAELAALSAGDLFRDVFVAPNLDLLLNVVDVARGWQLGSPWALLGKSVATAACDNNTLSINTGIMSSPIPLNFLLGIVGDPGLGKGGTMGARIFPYSYRAATGAIGGMNPISAPRIRCVFPASGPAFVSEFFDTEMVDNGRGKEVPTPVRHGDPIWAEWSEVDALVAKARGVSGSTLDPLIRSIHTGEALGDKSISRAKDNVGMVVEPGTYRCIVVVGIQPDRALVIIRDGGGGSLQRYVFLELVDKDAPHEDDLFRIRCQLHRRMGLPLPRDDESDAPSLYVHAPAAVRLDADVKRAVRRARREVLTASGKIAKEDTHAVNNRLRFAAIYAGWKLPPGTPAVIDADAWRWAGAVMEYSRRVRASIDSRLTTGKLAEARERGVLMGVSKAAADAHAEETREVHVRALSLTLVEKIARKPGQTRRDIRGGASKSQREIIYDALDLAEDMGRIYQANGAYFIKETEN